MRISENGINLIKNFEGCRLKAYKPVAGEQYWTIGWGHYGPDVTQGMTITQEKADELLRSDLLTYEAHVRRICNYLTLNQNEFDALVSFTYNCGSGNLSKLTKSQTRTKEEIAEHIEAYNKGAGGVTLAGLVKRRKAEKELFLTPVIMNKDKLDYLGITKFHELGFNGEGIAIGDREGNSTSHGSMVYEVLREVCPGAVIKIKTQYVDLPEVDIYTTSSFFCNDTYHSYNNKAKQLYDSGTLLCCAVGNEGEVSSTELSKDEWWTSIGACELDSDGIARARYSSITEDLDFMSLTGFKTTNGKFTGTSCATPVFAGMCAIVQSYFLKRFGKKLTPQELLRLVKDNCVDMQEKGKDKKTGYGLFRLPDTEDLEVYMRFNNLDEVPGYARETITKLCHSGILKGKEGGLDLSEDMVRLLVILDRAGNFDK